MAITLLQVRKKMTGNNPHLDFVYCISKCIQSLLKLCPFVLKILSANKILIPIQGRTSVTNKQNLTGNNPDLDLVNIN